MTKAGTSARRQDRPVFLVGVKNTGKSVLARLVAERLGWSYADVDELIERAYAAHSGTRSTVRDIYRIDSGETFRRLEAEACRTAAQLAPPVIVAAGGGLCDNPEAVTQLEGCVVVTLEGDPRILFERIMRNGIPAYFTARTREDAREEFEQLHARRTERYRAISNVVFRVGDRRPAQTARELALKIKEHLNGGK